MAAVLMVTWLVVEQGRRSCGDFINRFFFYSQPAITFTTAHPGLTTKRVAPTANTLYMEFIKQWLSLNSLAAFSIKLHGSDCVCAHLCACTCKKLFLCVFVCSTGWIYPFLGTWQPVCHPLHNQELTFRSITTTIPQYLSSPLPSSLHFHCLSHPISSSPLPRSASPSLFCSGPYYSLCHWSLMRFAASVLSNDLHW